MLELPLVLLLSIIFTFITYLFSLFFIKKLNITHPKNRSLIFIYVMLTALMIFSIATPLLGTPQTTEDTEEISSDHQYTQSIIIIDVIHDESAQEDHTLCLPVVTKEKTDIVYSDEWKQIPWQSVEQFDKETENSLPSSFCLVGTRTIQYELPLSIQQEAFDSDYTYPTALDIPPSQTMGEPSSTTTDDVSLLSLFWQVNILLLSIGMGYFILSLTIGKIYLLRSMHATKCTDHAVLSLIGEITAEFHLKMPRVYTYEGKPNAFIFTYPTTLVFSNELSRILTREELKLTFRHELAHIKNKDMLLKPLLQTLRIIFFYNPFIHLAYYRIIKEREFLADHYHIWSKSQKVTYMEALLKIHKHPLAHSRPSVPSFLTNSFTMPLFHNPLKRLSITERFDRLFNEMKRKSICTLIVCILLLFTNISIFSLADNIIGQSIDNSQDIDDTYESSSGAWYLIESYTLEYRSGGIVSEGQSHTSPAHEFISRIILFSYQDTEDNCLYQQILFLSLPASSEMFNGYQSIPCCDPSVPF
jgi:beta-lactamase regulating signal transducer with metallopeptidase domain